MTLKKRLLGGNPGFLPFFSFFVTCLIIVLVDLCVDVCCFVDVWLILVMPMSLNLMQCCVVWQKCFWGTIEDKIMNMGIFVFNTSSFLIYWFSFLGAE